MKFPQKATYRTYARDENVVAFSFYDKVKFYL